jgi:hypothetical protein
MADGEYKIERLLLAGERVFIGNIECVEGSPEMRKSATADLRWFAAISCEDARERAFGARQDVRETRF